MSGKPELVEDFRDVKKENVGRRISFWAALIFSIGLTGWYYLTSPPDSLEVRQMRMFFKENIMEVTKFIRLPYDERLEFAKKKQHSFYRTFIEASEVEKKKIKALIHISYDYTPNQYWFNVLFLWVIFFSTFWFLGLMAEAVVILVRSDDAKRKQRHRKKTS